MTCLTTKTLHIEVKLFMDTRCSVMGIDSLTAHQGNPQTHLLNALKTVPFHCSRKSVPSEHFDLDRRLTEGFVKKDVISFLDF